MSAAPPIALGKRLGGACALALIAVVGLLGLIPATASAATCPSFRVLHDDRIGPASLPAGSYTITPEPSFGLPCGEASRLFTRFLQDWDGNLPKPWKVVAEGSGKASFSRGGTSGFSVARTDGGEGGGNNPSLGDSAAAPSRSTPTPASARSSSPKAGTCSTSPPARGSAATAPRPSSPASSGPAAPSPPPGD